MSDLVLPPQCSYFQPPDSEYGQLYERILSQTDGIKQKNPAWINYGGKGLVLMPTTLRSDYRAPQAAYYEKKYAFTHSDADLKKLLALHNNTTIVYENMGDYVLWIEKKSRDKTKNLDIPAGSLFPRDVNQYLQNGRPPLSFVRDEVTPFYLNDPLNPLDDAYLVRYIFPTKSGDFVVATEITEAFSMLNLEQIINNRFLHQAIFGSKITPKIVRKAPDDDMQFGDTIKPSTSITVINDNGNDRWFLVNSFGGLFTKEVQNLARTSKPWIETDAGVASMIFARGITAEAMHKRASTFLTQAYEYGNCPALRQIAAQDATKLLSNAQTLAELKRIATYVGGKILLRYAAYAITSMLGQASDIGDAFNIPDASLPDFDFGDFDFGDFDTADFDMPDFDMPDFDDANLDVTDSNIPNSAIKHDVHFGAEVSTRFDTDFTTPDGHSVGSDAAGNLIDKTTGEGLSRY